MPVVRIAPTLSLRSACALLLATVGCTGSIQNGTGTGATGSSTGMATGSSTGAAGATGVGTGVAGTGVTGVGTGTAGTGVAANCTATSLDPGEAPLRRLTQEQYTNTIRDLFGTSINLNGVYPNAQGASQFGLAQADVDGVDLDNYQRAAELTAAAVVADKANLNRVAPCASAAVAADARTCARTFLQAYGGRIYRTPVAAADLDRHLGLYDAGAANGGFTHGMELLLRGMLQSPRFLYRVELGTSEAVAAGAVKLSGYELAARLSYGFWSSTPDEALTTAAATGKLATPADVATQLQRMLADPKGQTMVRHFLESWIHLPELNNVAKDGKLYPEWNDDMRGAIAKQAQRFFDDVLGAKGGTLAALLTSKTVFVNNKLAPVYGMQAAALPADGSFMGADKGDGTAAGLFSLPAFLATQAKAAESSPIYRGIFVREQLFCQQLPSPPANIPLAPEVTPGVSTRERLKQHEVSMECAACHVLIDPIGLGFEHYDAIGRYRTMDGGKAVDATGSLSGTDVNGPFNGVVELASRLTGSATVEACVGKQWFRYSMGRAEGTADACSVASMAKTFHDAGGDLRALPMAIVQTPAFLYRRPLAAGSN